MATSRVYARRDPTMAALHGLVRRHLVPFVRFASERSGRPLPRYVVEEFRAYLRCGVLAHDFARARCAGCGHERLVAFSCKLRGVCPSCGGRWMSATAADVVDRVLPEVPLRQWVLSVPFALRVRLAADPAMLNAVSRVLWEEMRRWYRSASGLMPGDGVRVEAGAITFVQRFGGALNLNVHFHMVTVDGVWRCPTDGSTPVFVPVRSGRLHMVVAAVLAGCGSAVTSAAPADGGLDRAAVPDKLLAPDAPETPDAPEDRDLASPLDAACLAPRLVCGGRCVDPAVDRDHCGGCGVRCCAGSSCASGRCRPDCAEEQTACPTSEAGDAGCFTGGSCRNLANDNRNCGACRQACCLGNFCVRGSCQTGCSVGFTECPAQPLPPTAWAGSARTP